MHCLFPGLRHKQECITTVSFRHSEIYEIVFSDFLDFRMLVSFCFNILFFNSWAMTWLLPYSQALLPPSPFLSLSRASFSLSLSLSPYCSPKGLGGKDKASPTQANYQNKQKRGRGERGNVLNIITNNCTQSFLYHLMLKCIRSN